MSNRDLAKQQGRTKTTLNQILSFLRWTETPGINTAENVFFLNGFPKNTLELFSVKLQTILALANISMFQLFVKYLFHNLEFPFRKPFSERALFKWK